jgi:hypothetical protein
MIAPPSPFSTTIPNFQIAWDSTSLGWLKTCPRLYYYSMIEGWQPKNKSHHLVFGGHYAKGVERYAQAVVKVVRLAMEETWDAETGQPWESGDPYKNRYTLIRTLIWNLDDRAESPWSTTILSNGKPAVELSFNFDVFDFAGEAISLSGHMDEIVENAADPGKRWVKDDKTTRSAPDANYFAKYSPDNQMTLYTIAGGMILGDKLDGVLVRAAQIGVGFARFATQPTSRPKAVLEEWLGDLRYWISQAHHFATTNHWPMNDTACHKYTGCAFRRVCSVSPSHRKSWLEADFERRVWNPLDARGDDV